MSGLKPSQAVRAVLSQEEARPVSQIARDAGIDRVLARTVLSSLASSQEVQEGPAGYWRRLTRQEAAQARGEARAARVALMREGCRKALLDILTRRGDEPQSAAGLAHSLLPPVQSRAHRGAAWRGETVVRAPRYDFRPSQVEALLGELVADGRVVVRAGGYVAASQALPAAGAPRARVRSQQAAT